MAKVRGGVKACCGKLSDCAGVTLLEVLVALVLLVLLSGSVINIAVVSGRWVATGGRQNQASTLAFGILDYYRAAPERLESGPLSGEDARELLISEPVEKHLYPWQADYQPCGPQVGLWEVQVRVNWDGGQSEKAVQMCTLLYAPD